MKLWSIQREAIWRTLVKQGAIFTPADKAEATNHDAYVWLAEQMRVRLPNHPTLDTTHLFPVWAWFQWESEHRPMPDLRYSAHLPRGEKGVRLELEVPDEMVLLSDFELWHFALNYWYLPSSMLDGDRFDREMSERGLSNHRERPLSDQKAHNEIQHSWEKIFDLDWQEKDYSSPRELKNIQATLWSIEMDFVKDVTHFTAK